MLLGVLVDPLDVVLGVAGKLGCTPGISFGSERILPVRMPRIAVGIEPSRPLIAPCLGISLPLMPGA